MKGPKTSSQTRAAWRAAKGLRLVIEREAECYSALGAHDSDPTLLGRMAEALVVVERVAVRLEDRDTDRWVALQE